MISAKTLRVARGISPCTHCLQLVHVLVVGVHVLHGLLDVTERRGSGSSFCKQNDGFVAQRVVLDAAR